MILSADQPYNNHKGGQVTFGWLHGLVGSLPGGLVAETWGGP